MKAGNGAGNQAAFDFIRYDMTTPPLSRALNDVIAHYGAHNVATRSPPSCADVTATVLQIDLEAGAADQENKIFGMWTERELWFHLREGVCSPHPPSLPPSSIHTHVVYIVFRAHVCTSFTLTNQPPFLSLLKITPPPPNACHLSATYITFIAVGSRTRIFLFSTAWQRTNIRKVGCHC